MAQPNLFKDARGNYYTRGAVVWKDIDTPGPQFAGWVTLASCKNDNCIDHWTRVEPVKGKLIIPVVPKPKIRPIAKILIKFRGQWNELYSVMSEKPVCGDFEMTISEPIKQIKVVYR